MSDRERMGPSLTPREHIYWDQAPVLVRLGLLSPAGLPIAGVDTARKVMDPTDPRTN